MVPHMPTGYTGGWLTTEEVGFPYNWSASFNSTMPASHGSVPNNIQSVMPHELATRLTNLWYYQEGALRGVVHGCVGKCKAKLVAPALAVTSCSSRQVPFDINLPYRSWVLQAKSSPSLAQQAYLNTVTLVVDRENESINLVTGYATLDDECSGPLNYTACTLESAVGKYDITIEDNLATLDAESVSNPYILAMPNNPAVTHRRTWEGTHPSTLAGIVSMQWVKWDSYFAMYRVNAKTYH